MKNEDLKGLISALVVPFNEDGTVNEAGLRQIIRHNIENMKVDGLYVGGSSGENFMLEKETKKQIFKIAKDEVKEQVSLIAQVGGTNLYEAIELGQYATELGYDAISAVTPFYYKFSFEEVKQYYFDLVDNVDNRLIVYSIPALTGVEIGVSQFKELYENEKIIGVKFTAADFFLLERLRKACPDHLILSGFDEMLLPAMINNVDGAIGSTYNVNGLRSRKIMELAQEGKIQEALAVQNDTNDLIEAILDNGLYPTIKQLLKLQGCDSGAFLSRKPMASATQAQIDRSQEIYETYLKDIK
ncbi:N-acetylneuraminate lyase [Vagococcus lutrae]|uniref:N-acetylneuraminate lyase n=1 Tax=Vagococcus lutrae TaxID=81947 RepID=UPI0028915DA6|nr:N-acetylneuraminate lyase [Vagococcus lutrae]MDT2802011.1 N-acetylneuraminate lyase [Vagococcus lutrae]MDT2825978.1 N-acetylneuraminate lyase [Vagococcus lutrae]